MADVYRRCREALFEQLGVQPSEQTRNLYERLSSGERVDVPVAVRHQQGPGQDEAAPGEPPFNGLQFFDEIDASRFFGRERLVARLLDRLRSERFFVLVGASGSGKSSVVRAGLVPALRAARLPDGSAAWTVHVLTPTGQPLDALAAAVTGSPDERAALLRGLTADPRALRLHFRGTAERGCRILIVVDQFEELFTLCRDAFEREAFADSLLAASSEDGPASVVLAVRADFYAHCGQSGELREAMAHHQEYLGPMTADELRRAIEAPAEYGGWSFEAGLVDLFLKDVGEEPGALPLLSHALLATWQRRRGRRLTFGGYAEAGGVRGSIGASADFTFRERLLAEQQAIARRIFLRLTELGEGTQDTRRRASLEELVPRTEDASHVYAVLQTLAAARLITLGENSVEVAHEALIREWPTLRNWLDEDRAGLRLHRRLSEVAQEWARHARDPDLLYRGARLVEAQEWADAHPAELNEAERMFVQAAADLGQRETAQREAVRQRELEAARRLAVAEQQRAEEQRHTAHRLRRRALALGAALVLALSMAGTAIFFGAQAHQGTLAAEASARVAVARELAADAVGALDTDPQQSILLALQAVATTASIDGTATPDAENALHRAVLTSRIRLMLPTHGGPVSAVAFSPDGTRVATADTTGALHVWDSASGASQWMASGHPSGANDLAFSPDGGRIVASGEGTGANIRDAQTGDLRLMLDSHAAPVTRVAFSADGARIAAASSNGSVTLWDAATGQQFGTVYGSDIRDMSFSPNGGRLLTVDHGGTIHIWDASGPSSSVPILALRVAGEGLSAAFSPNGRRVAAVDGTDVRIWDADTGTELQRVTASSNTLTRVAYAPDGTRLAIGGLDHQVTLWDAGSGRQLVDVPRFVGSSRHLITLAGHTGAITSLGFAPDGTRLASGAEDGSARVWDIGGTRELLALPIADWQRSFSADSNPDWLGRVAYDPRGTTPGGWSPGWDSGGLGRGNRPRAPDAQQQGLAEFADRVHCPRPCLQSGWISVSNGW